MNPGESLMRTIVTGLVALLVLVVMFVALGCASLPPRPEGPTLTALPAGEDTRLDRLVAPALDEHPGESGFHLVSDGVQAFALRGLSARAAGRSLDVQYYIWNDDLTGRLLALELLDAADRGVRVRMLLDDMDARAKNFALAALAAHPNISVRLFNPFASRQGLFGKGMEALTSFSRINHRMHNKTWISDNRFAVAGGRNVGDEYFAASEHVNFNDLDLAIVGPAVQELSDSFDRYWNSEAVWPIEALSPDAVNADALATLRRQGEAYALAAQDEAWVKALAGHDAMQSARASVLPMHWTSQWQVLADVPGKVVDSTSSPHSSEVLRGLTAALNESREEVVLISPYFVPGDTGTAELLNAVDNGRRVRILTNSLAANDVAAVHGGYAKYREELINGGVRLWELKPEQADSGEGAISLFGSSGASLHSKAALFDGRTAFVGSFNLDPRSVSLNCEQGILVTEPAIADEVAQLFDAMTAPSAAWQVTRSGRRELEWSDGTVIYDQEPEAGSSRLFQARLARWLPIEPLL
jgi:putative cardiolipin synthase